MTRRRQHSDCNDPVAEALDRLCEELSVVRHVLDDIYCELQWANRNRPSSESQAGTVRRITSMPLDPTAADWAERLNRFSAADSPIEDEDSEPSAAEQGHLF